MSLSLYHSCGLTSFSGPDQEFYPHLNTVPMGKCDLFSKNKLYNEKGRLFYLFIEKIKLNLSSSTTLPYFHQPPKPPFLLKMR